MGLRDQDLDRTRVLFLAGFAQALERSLVLAERRLVPAAADGGETHRPARSRDEDRVRVRAPAREQRGEHAVRARVVAGVQHRGATVEGDPPGERPGIGRKRGVCCVEQIARTAVVRRPVSLARGAVQPERLAQPAPRPRAGHGPDAPHRLRHRRVAGPARERAADVLGSHEPRLRLRSAAVQQRPSPGRQRTVHREQPRALRVALRCRFQPRHAVRPWRRLRVPVDTLRHAPQPRRPLARLGRPRRRRIHAQIRGPRLCGPIGQLQPLQRERTVEQRGPVPRIPRERPATRLQREQEVARRIVVLGPQQVRGREVAQHTRIRFRGQTRFLKEGDGPVQPVSRRIRPEQAEQARDVERVRIVPCTQSSLRFGCQFERGEVCGGARRRDGVAGDARDQAVIARLRARRMAPRQRQPRLGEAARTERVRERGSERRCGRPLRRPLLPAPGGDRNESARDGGATPEKRGIGDLAPASRWSSRHRSGVSGWGMPAPGCAEMMHRWPANCQMFAAGAVRAVRVQSRALAPGGRVPDEEGLEPVHAPSLQQDGRRAGVVRRAGVTPGDGADDGSAVPGVVAPGSARLTPPHHFSSAVGP